MINITRILFLCAAVTLFITVKSSAQTTPPEERATALTASMDCELALTSEQLPVIHAINLEASIGMDSARAHFKFNIKQ